MNQVFFRGGTEAGQANGRGEWRDGAAHAKARRWAKDAAQVSESGTRGGGGGRGEK